MDFVVRTARPEEFEAVGVLTVQAYRDLVSTGAAGQEYLARMYDVASRAAATELLVAVDPTSHEVLGGVSFVAPGTSYVAVSRPGEGEFRLLAVAPEARHCGIGEALVQACLDRATQLGLDGMAITTQPNMQAAHRLYQRMGFTRAPDRDWEPVPGVPLWTFVKPLRLQTEAGHRAREIPRLIEQPLGTKQRNWPSGGTGASAVGRPDSRPCRGG